MKKDKGNPSVFRSFIILPLLSLLISPLFYFIFVIGCADDDSIPPEYDDSIPFGYNGSGPSEGDDDGSNPPGHDDSIPFGYNGSGPSEGDDSRPPEAGGGAIEPSHNAGVGEEGEETVKIKKILTTTDFNIFKSKTEPFSGILMMEVIKQGFILDSSRGTTTGYLANGNENEHKIPLAAGSVHKIVTICIECNGPVSLYDAKNNLVDQHESSHDYPFTPSNSVPASIVSAYFVEENGEEFKFVVNMKNCSVPNGCHYGFGVYSLNTSEWHKQHLDRANLNTPVGVYSVNTAEWEPYMQGLNRANLTPEKKEAFFSRDLKHNIVKGHLAKDNKNEHEISLTLDPRLVYRIIVLSHRSNTISHLYYPDGHIKDHKQPLVFSPTVITSGTEHNNSMFEINGGGNFTLTVYMQHCFILISKCHYSVAIYSSQKTLPTTEPTVERRKHRFEKEIERNLGNTIRDRRGFFVQNSKLGITKRYLRSGETHQHDIQLDPTLLNKIKISKSKLCSNCSNVDLHWHLHNTNDDLVDSGVINNPALSKRESISIKINNIALSNSRNFKLVIRNSNHTTILMESTMALPSILAKLHKGKGSDQLRAC